MIKLDTLSRWAHLAPQTVLTLPGQENRKIRLEVNAPGRVRLYLMEDEELRFLAAPEGRDTVEFWCPGDVKIVTDDADVFVYTAELEPTFVEIENTEVFTEIAERAARNPEMERMMYLAQQNAERRFAQLAQEATENARRAYEAGRIAATPSPNGATKVGEQNPPSGPSVQPVEPPNPSGEGSGGGD